MEKEVKTCLTSWAGQNFMQNTHRLKELGASKEYLHTLVDQIYEISSVSIIKADMDDLAKIKKKGVH